MTVRVPPAVRDLTIADEEDSPVAWKESGPMHERFKFVMEAGKGEKPIAMLCREFGVSRTTGHMWLRRYEDEPWGTPMQMGVAIPPEVLARVRFVSQRGQRRLQHLVGGRLKSIVSLQGIYRVGSKTAEDLLALTSPIRH
jgi:transposase-like protein